MIEQGVFRLWLFRNRAATTRDTPCFSEIYIEIPTSLVNVKQTHVMSCTVANVWLLSAHLHVNTYCSSVYVGWCLRNNERLSSRLHLSCCVASLPVGKSDFMVIFGHCLSLSLSPFRVNQNWCCKNHGNRCPSPAEPQTQNSQLAEVITLMAIFE